MGKNGQFDAGELELVKARFDELVAHAARREAALMIREANKSRKEENMDERLNGHYTFRLKKWLTPFVGMALGAVLTFVINARLQDQQNAIELAEQQRIIQEVKQSQVNRELFDATILPIKNDIQEIKHDIKEHMLDAQDRVTTRRYDKYGNVSKETQR